MPDRYIEGGAHSLAEREPSCAGYRHFGIGYGGAERLQECAQVCADV